MVVGFYSSEKDDSIRILINNEEERNSLFKSILIPIFGSDLNKVIIQFNFSSDPRNVYAIAYPTLNYDFTLKEKNFNPHINVIEGNMVSYTVKDYILAKNQFFLRLSDEDIFV